MTTKNLTQHDFQQTIEQDGTVVVDFWAPWCGPCRSFAPVFEAEAERRPAMTFAKVNTEDERELAGALQIRSIPTLMIFRDGIMVFRQPGALPGNVLTDLVNQVDALDMDDVRRQMAEQSAAAG